MSNGFAYALDFDGVICDSVNESSISGVRACARVWDKDDQLAKAAETLPQWLLESMRSVRPVVETGYENVILARALIHSGEEKASTFVASVLSEWPEIREDLTQLWNVDKEQLIEAFGTVRDEWIQKDENSWVSANKFFPGVADALNFAESPLYIITTKQTRFCKLLLERNGVRNIPEDRIYGYGSGTKISVLKTIMKFPESKGRSLVFVEDRYETLEKATLSLLGQPIEYFLASWGYNTEAVRSEAVKHPFINLLDLPSFTGKLQ